jgi:hypothetical protein
VNREMCTELGGGQQDYRKSESDRRRQCPGRHWLYDSSLYEESRPERHLRTEGSIVPSWGLKQPELSKRGMLFSPSSTVAKGICVDSWPRSPNGYGMTYVSPVIPRHGRWRMRYQEGALYGSTKQEERDAAAPGFEDPRRQVSHRDPERAITIITVLLILLISPKAGAKGFVRRCPVCDHVLMSRGSYCSECGSKV